MTSAATILADGTITSGELHAYMALLFVSGAIMIVLGAVGFGATTGSRILNVVLGVLALIYGLYLALGDPSTVIISYYAFVVPILGVVTLFRSRRNRSRG